MIAQAVRRGHSQRHRPSKNDSSCLLRDLFAPLLCFTERLRRSVSRENSTLMETRKKEAQEVLFQHYCITLDTTLHRHSL